MIITYPILSIDDHDLGGSDSGVSVKEKIKVKRPRKYKVLIHNDDYTTMEFVIFVLKKHFDMDHEKAHQVMMKVHNEGVGVCGVYTFEVAESKTLKVTKEAEKEGYPLLCTFEPE